MDIDRKVRRAAILLLVRRRGYPGVREWELEKYLGRNYIDVIKRLSQVLEPLGLEVKEVEVEEEGRRIKHFLVVPKRLPEEPRDLVKPSLRRDELAILGISVLMIMSSEGSKVLRKDVVDIASTKIGRYRVEQILNKLIRLRYLREDGEYLTMGIRSLLEIDIDRLAVGMLSKRNIFEKPSSSSPREEG